MLMSKPKPPTINMRSGFLTWSSPVNQMVTIVTLTVPMVSLTVTMVTINSKNVNINSNIQMRI